MSAETRTSPDEVRTALDDVYDPELDRSVTELEFVDDIEITGRSVSVSLRLPTGLCSPSFAWMMAADVRDAVLDLPDVDDVTVSLRDHVHDEEITRGVNDGASFQDVFEDAEADLEELRWTFDHKARLGRQHDAMTVLLEEGVDPHELVAITHGDVRLNDGVATVSVDDRSVSVPAEPIDSYLEKVDVLGIDASPDAPFFVTPEEEAIPPTEFESVRRLTRLSSVNMDGQAHECSLLLEARYGD
ncbi:iron-sulfur cluster assembly protein [Natrarchaeobius oligotrophus]|uniref:DUF59 domain-containing protein n=1 Tax=Natrarchaeobius chitinivorans TaxID=1679083 RepID=A0A3N6NRD9_NATCH|nr:iron-sulfur cluster assembly protein [Natrarchaeobius chitinivorans]RQH02593.1 DUF59 domain-containing protein [Natrarchaeobius chitinivorans]